MKRDGRVARHLLGRLPLVLPLLLVVLVAVALTMVAVPPQASATEDATITLTSNESMFIDSNKPTTEGPQCSWISFDIANASSAPGYETLTNVVVTFTMTGGTEYFAQPADNVREFASLDYPDTVPVFFYIDYFNALDDGPGVSGTYEVTVEADGMTPVTHAGTITTVSSISANAGGSNVTTALGPGIYVGQILTTTMTYTFGNNEDISFQPSGATGFNETAYRLVGNKVTSIVTKKPNNYSGIAVNEGDQLRWELSDIPESGTEFTMEYYWEVLVVGENAWVNPWAEGLSGNDYKYTGTDVVSEIPAALDAPITVTKTVDPDWLATAGMTTDYGEGIVRYTVDFTNTLDPAVPEEDVTIILSRIIDLLPGDATNGYVTMYDSTATGSEVTTSNSSQVPALGDDLEVTWKGKGARYDNREYSLGPGETLTLVYLADVTDCAPGVYDNEVYGRVGNDETAHAEDFFEIGDPTLAVVSDFQAYKSRSNVVLAWETASEAGTVGFYLERLDEKKGDWTRVNQEILPALFGAPLGGAYSMVDPDAKPGAKLTYRLVELDSSGETETYGPYEVKAQVALPSSRGAADIAHGKQSVRIPKPVANSAGQQVDESSDRVVGRENASVDRMRIEVVDAGLCVVSASEVAAGLDLTPAKATKMIADGDLELTSQGIDVAYLAAEDGSKLYFYGEAIDSLYTSANVYWLTRGDGLAMALETDSSTVATGPEELVTTFTHTLHAEQDLEGAPMMFHDPESDFWLWKYVFSGYGLETATVDLNVPDMVGGGDMVVRLHGMNTTGVADEHCIQVSLNGVVLGQITWSGVVAREAGFDLPDGVLHSGENELAITALKGSTNAVSWIGLDSVDITYERAAFAVSDRLLITSPVSGPVRVGSLSTPDAWVLDVSAPNAPEIVPVQNSGGEAGAVWIAFNAKEGGTYLVCTEAAALQPAAMAGTASGVLGRNGHSDYVIITTNDLSDAAQSLADYRAGQGLKTTVVTVNEIYDEFNHGIIDPHAIQAFLKTAYSTWQPAPAYVVLVGEGSFDYKNVKGNGDCLVPSLLVGTDYGLATSDVLFGDVVGSDGVPEISIGRLPVLNESELGALVAKIKGYEAATGSWRNSVLLAADNADDGGDFATDSDNLAALLPSSLTVDKAYLDSMPIATAKEKVRDAFTSGSLWVNYIGHAGIGQLAGEGLLTWPEAKTLTATGFKLPVVSIFSCMAGAYWLPGADGLSEILVKLPTAGAIAVWAPSAWQLNVESVALGSIFVRNTFGSSETVVIGNQILAAQREAVQSGVPAVTIDTYNLLGDPALRVSR